MSATTPQLVAFWSLNNLSAPASGNVQAARFSVALSGDQVNLPMSQYISGLGSFQPQAVTVDNLTGVAAITIGETTFGWSRIIPAGEFRTFQFPAVQNPIFTLASVGAVTADLTFMDWPAFPDSDLNPAVAAGLPVTITGQPVSVVQQPAAAVYAAPSASSIAVGGTAVTVFNAGVIVNGADVINPPAATETLYVDAVAPAVAGSATSIPLAPGASYRFGATAQAISAVAATTGHTFVAVRF